MRRRFPAKISKSDVRPLSREGHGRSFYVTALAALCLYIKMRLSVFDIDRDGLLIAVFIFRRLFTLTNGIASRHLPSVYCVSSFIERHKGEAAFSLRVSVPTFVAKSTSVVFSPVVGILQTVKRETKKPRMTSVRQYEGHQEHQRFTLVRSGHQAGRKRLNVVV